MKIGIFDSGLGGLITLKEITKKLPDYNYIYLGDNARSPYGNRSAEVVYNFTLQAVDFLFKQDCQLIIIACNTATAAALRKLQQEYLPAHYSDRRILGVTRPLAEKAALICQGKMGVMGTKGTINSSVFNKELEKLGFKNEIISVAAPLLVPIIEDGEANDVVINEILSKYLAPFKKAEIDTLILGCTHYPILISEIQKIMGDKVEVINSGEVIAESLADYLFRHPEFASSEPKAPGLGPRFCVTDLSEHYQQLGEQWFGKDIKFEKINLE